MSNAAVPVSSVTVNGVDANVNAAPTTGGTVRTTSKRVPCGSAGFRVGCARSGCGRGGCGAAVATRAAATQPNDQTSSPHVSADAQRRIVAPSRAADAARPRAPAVQRETERERADPDDEHGGGVDTGEGQAEH